MYVPQHFAGDAAAIDEIVASHDFALLVTTGAQGPEATHLPLLLDRSRGPQGTLLGHLARANPHAEALDGREALAIFSGPHGYVSPRWYAAAPAVPTWNYVAVHVHGRARVVRDKARLVELVDTLSRRYEGDGPWSVAGLPERFLAGMVEGIVGLEIDIERIDAKFKLSQNRPPGDRRNVIAELERGGDAGGAALAATMRRFAPPPS
jgi:transcriptional regulator